ncbi:MULTISPECIES: hypothetical protein [unclassified Butyrivibrio]|jgi:hypothetical protein|uniref:hypothetical protein n=1 Tax=unclassified Butyrivibrio TaxID=2639466 RepID=UPI0003B385D7|nr:MULTISPECIES: hypothetical protein [unclassified Butyrivibrio]MDC7292100.1 hypothetical protein [Butyrivibrio sp. DSM 10294]
MTKRNVGWVLVIIGLFMLFKMVRVSSFGFYRIGRVSTSAIVLILLILSAIAVVVNKNKFTVGCLVMSLILLVAALVLGTELYFAYSSLTDVLLVFVPVVIGAGLIIKSAFERHGKKKTELEY